jgi:outer membrane protein assembly factor BamB
MGDTMIFLFHRRFHENRKFFLFTGILFLFFSVFLPAQRAGPTLPSVGAAPVWYRDLGELILGQPHLQAESVVLACTSGAIKSFFRTGTQLWNFNQQEPATPFVARSVEGATYTCDTSGNFRAINRVGRELWRVTLERPICHPPIVGWDGRVFIPADSELSCRTASGRSLWSIDLGSPIALAPILDRIGSFVTVLENGDFVKVNQFSTVDRLRLTEMPFLIASMISGNRKTYVLLYPNGAAESIIFDESALRGSRLSRDRFPSLPAAPAAAIGRGGEFAVTLRDGRVLLIDETGQVLWSGNSHETAVERGAANLNKDQAAMVFDERGIYSITTRGVTGFAADGRRRFIHRIEEASSIPALSDEGILYVTGRSRNLYSYKLDSRARTTPRFRYYGYAPEGTYGMGSPPPSPWASDSWRYDPNEQNAMVARIEDAINSGQIGEREPYYKAYLMEMIGFFLNDPHYSRVRPNVLPTLHIEFIRLLGRIGSRETVPFLWRIFDTYHDPTVRAACAEAIGNIGVDPYGNTYMSFSFFLAANNPNRDPRLLMSATTSIAALSRFSGPPLSGEGIILLRHFSNLTWAPLAIRNQINMELEALFREGLDQPMR